MTDDVEKIRMLDEMESKILSNPIEIVFTLLDQIKRLNESVEDLTQLAVQGGAKMFPELDSETNWVI